MQGFEVKTRIQSKLFILAPWELAEASNSDLMQIRLIQGASLSGRTALGSSGGTGLFVLFAAGVQGRWGDVAAIQQFANRTQLLKD